MQGYEDGPHGDENYSGARGENSRAYRRFSLLPPGWAPAASQHAATKATNQGEAAALLDSRKPLLVCAGGVYLPP